MLTCSSQVPDQGYYCNETTMQNQRLKAGHASFVRVVLMTRCPGVITPSPYFRNVTMFDDLRWDVKMLYIL